MNPITNLKITKGGLRITWDYDDQPCVFENNQPVTHSQAIDFVTGLTPAEMEEMYAPGKSGNFLQMLEQIGLVQIEAGYENQPNLIGNFDING